MQKPLRSDISFGHLPDGEYAIIQIHKVPRGVPRSTPSDYISSKTSNEYDTETVKAGLVRSFIKDGFTAVGPEPVCYSSCYQLAVVSVSELRKRAPEYFGWEDSDLLLLYQKHQQEDTMHEFPRDELKRAKELWTDMVSCTVHYNASLKDEKVDPPLACEGNYADALPNY